MKNITTPFLAILTVSLLVPLQAYSEEGEDPFDYTRTMATYHMVEGGGHINVRPREYNPLHGFIIIYEAMDQYMAALGNKDNQRFMDPGNLPVLNEIVLVNDVSQKRYFVKEYWLGDGKNWVPMSRADYDRLKDMLDGHLKRGDKPTPENKLEVFTDRIHERSAYNDYSGYEWEGENVRQYPPWKGETATHEEASSPEAVKPEQDVETLVDSATEEAAKPRDTASTKDTPLSGTQTSTQKAEHPTNQTQSIIKSRGNDPIRLNSTGDAQKTEKQAEASNRPSVWIAVLFALIAGVFLYTRRKS